MQLIDRTPGAVRRVAEDALAADVWELTLVVFGALGLISTLMPRTKAVFGLGMELVARLGLGIGSLTYGLAIATGAGRRSEFSMLTYLGISMLMFFACVQIIGWLREQRRSVDKVLAQMEVEKS